MTFLTSIGLGRAVYTESHLTTIAEGQSLPLAASAVRWDTFHHGIISSKSSCRNENPLLPGQGTGPEKNKSLFSYGFVTISFLSFSLCLVPD